MDSFTGFTDEEAMADELVLGFEEQPSEEMLMEILNALVMQDALLGGRKAMQRTQPIPTNSRPSPQMMDQGILGFGNAPPMAPSGTPRRY